MKTITKANEDYLEAILLLGGDNNQVKSVNIAKHLGVSKPAVTLATNALLENKLIEKVNYGDIRLTETGAEIARATLNKHNFIKTFLLAIGVSEVKAEVECCNMEHYLSDETLDCISSFCSDHGIAL